MKNYESTVSTEVNGLSFSFLSSAEIKSLSCSEIKNAGRIDHESAGKSCIYDPSMGSTEIYRLCSTCNEMTNCDGHLGHINFAIPLFHPMMINSLCKLLKAVCYWVIILCRCVSTAEIWGWSIERWRNSRCFLRLRNQKICGTWLY